MIRLYDTMAREKRDFVPADPKRITMYVCGPTVYGRAHIGNARPPVVFDTLARLIRHEFGADSLVYARNVTDVDDKIIDAARAEGVEPSVITRRYEDHYLEDMRALGVRDPDIAPRATLEIAPMVAMIERLVGLVNAY
jgi:cysteinyl-tRNA synthetase